MHSVYNAFFWLVFLSCNSSWSIAGLRYRPRYHGSVDLKWTGEVLAGKWVHDFYITSGFKFAFHVLKKIFLIYMFDLFCLILICTSSIPRPIWRNIWQRSIWHDQGSISPTFNELTTKTQTLFQIQKVTRLNFKASN